MEEIFDNSNVLHNFFKLFAAALSLVVLTLNATAIIKITRRKAFLTGNFSLSTLFVLSICGTDLLVGLTTFMGFILTLVLNNRAPRYVTNFIKYLCIFSLLSSLLHVASLTLLRLISTKRQIDARDNVNAGKSMTCLLVLLIWIVSLTPSVIKTSSEDYKYLYLTLSTLLFFSNIFIFISYWYIKSKPIETTKVFEEPFNVRNNAMKKLKEKHRNKVKSLTLGLITSFFISSVPYTIYVIIKTVIYKTHQGTSLADDVMFLFILIKCMCDAIVYIFRTGCRRKSNRVKYRFTQNNSSSKRLTSEEAV